MTYSTLASIVKYPFSSSLAGNHSKFGFFQSEEADFKKIADELGILRRESPEGTLRYARYPLVFLVEAADDICYQIMDIEDAHKLKLLSTETTRELLLGFFEEERKAKILSNMQIVEDTNEQIVYLRSCVIGRLEQECVRVFVENEEAILNGTFEGPLLKHIAPIPRKAYEACTDMAFKKIYRSKDVVDVELAGFQVISTLLELMLEAVTHPEKTYSQLLINRVSTQYDIKATALYDRVMAVLDYISGMTDVYALDLYRKINGMSLPTL